MRRSRGGWATALEAFAQFDALTRLQIIPRPITRLIEVKAFDYHVSYWPRE